MVYSVSDAVKEVLGELTFLRASIDYDLLNYSAVARFIQPVVSSKLGYEAGLEAVAVAVRRYIQTFNNQPRPVKFLEAVKRCKIILRSDLCLVVVKQWNDVDFLQEIRSILPDVEFRAGEKLYLIARSNELVIVCSSRFLSTIESRISPPAKLSTKLTGLSVITIDVQQVDFEVPGVLQFFSQQFEMAGINIYEVFSTRGKITYVFSQRDAAKAYERISASIDAAKAMPFSQQRA